MLFAIAINALVVEALANIATVLQAKTFAISKYCEILSQRQSERNELL